MPRYKVMANLSWEFEGGDSFLDAFEKARYLVDQTIDQDPQGEDFGSFSVQMELVRCKEHRAAGRRLMEYDPAHVLTWVGQGTSRKSVRVKDQAYFVKMSASRYYVFKRGLTCVACGLKGTRCFLELDAGANVAHFNFYGEENGHLVLLTKDHIRAKSYGGTDTLDNFQTMCAPCNTLKASYPLEPESVRILRDLARNGDRLSTTQLRRKIRETRLLLVTALTGQ